MRSKFSLGIRESICIVVGTFIFFLLSALQMKLLHRGALWEDYIFMPAIFSSIYASIFGPLVGIVVGCIGHIFSCLIVYENVQHIDILIFTVSGLTMGLFADKFEVLSGRFYGKKILDFNVVNAMVCIMNLVMIRPILQMAIMKEDYSKALARGVNGCLGTELAAMVLGTALLYYVSYCFRKYGDRIKLYLIKKFR